MTSTRRVRLGALLVAAGVITSEQLQAALQHQASTPGRRRRVGELVVELGFCSEEAVARAVGQQLDLPFIDLASVVADAEVMRLIPRRLSHKHQIVPIRRTEEGTLVVAMADPTNVVAIDDVKTSSGMQEI